MTRVLFTGVTGLLGKYFLDRKLSGFEVVGTYNKNPLKNSFQLNITNRKEVFKLFHKFKPTIVVHAASLGSVDYCETHKEEAQAVNVGGTKNILEACKEINSLIIFTSSNAVYDGNNPKYSENSSLGALDMYGKTKIEAEKLIKNSGIPYIIVRLMTMYGWNNPNERINPATWVIEQLKNKKEIKVVDDIYNNHLYAGQAAEVLWKIIKEKKGNEIYNIAGKDCISRYELALKVAEVFNLDSSFITPVKNDYFKNIAPRPKNTCFNTSKLTNDLGIEPMSIIDGLKEMKNERT